MKKRINLLVAVLLSLHVFAQVPQKMSYQAVIRDANGSLIKSTTLGMRISILFGSPTGAAVYIETQTPTSNINGLVSLEIGTGTNLSGTTFSSINWATEKCYIKIETDLHGGAA